MKVTVNSVVKRLAVFALFSALLAASVPGYAFVSADDEESGDSEDEDPNEEFFEACAESDVETVKTMIEENSSLVNEFSIEGETCLMLVAIEQSVELATLLIDKGADINARALGEDNHRMPVLGWHALAGSSEIVTMLLAKGVDINAEFDGVHETGEKFGIFTVLDLMDFVIEAPSRMEEEPELDDEVTEMLSEYKKLRQVLIDNGGKKFVGSDEM